MTPGNLKYGESQLRCAVSVNDTGLQRLCTKKKVERITNKFYTNYMLKYYFGYIRLNEIYH